jgi:hypothetical protein
VDAPKIVDAQGPADSKTVWMQRVLSAAHKRALVQLGHLSRLPEAR